MTMRTAFAFIIFAAIVLFLAAPAAGVFAQSSGGNATPSSGGNPPLDARLINPLKANSFNDLLSGIEDVIINVGTVVVVLMVIYVGFMFVTARGEPAKISAAKQALLWTLIGALILLGAKAIQLGITKTVEALSA
ncbi:MAG TPA: hypothetical protein VFP46_02335 [Candidatus Paceibacterota bacterium]|nr:hypothetical protein [Candidatus Paceibacterota bacterium]